MKPAQAKLTAVLEHLKVDRVAAPSRGKTSLLCDIDDGRLLKVHYGTLKHGYLPSLWRLIDRRCGPDCWHRIDLYYTFYSLRFSDCKLSDNNTCHWCLRRQREL